MHRQDILSPVAQVPVHPREGRLWANVRSVGANTPLPSYPLDDLYDKAALDATAAAEHGRCEAMILECRDALNEELTRCAALECALRLVMACAGDIEKASDADLEAALECGDAEIERQANAWLVARAALMGPNVGVNRRPTPMQRDPQDGLGPSTTQSRIIHANHHS